MRLSARIYSLRYQTHQIVNDLVDSGEFINIKEALEYLVSESKRKHTRSGFDHCHNPYKAYMRFVQTYIYPKKT